jgi:glycosyltransferase involved in cell wall biosynthesis
VVGIVHLLAGDDLRKGMVSKALQRTYLHSIESCVYTSVATRKSSRSNVDSVVAHPASRFSPEVTEQEVRSEAQQDGLSVAFVGDISPVKGLDRLVKAVSRVPGCRLTVAGRTSDPRYAGRVKRLCSSLRVSDRVELAGVLEADELASLFSRSDVVAVPSDHESFGTAYLEGMSFGLPAVASPSGGACELIEHGRNGFLERDEIGVSDALSTLAENPDTLSRMSVEALRTERDWQDWKETTRKVVEHVERTAKG